MKKHPILHTRYITRTPYITPYITPNIRPNITPYITHYITHKYYTQILHTNITHILQNKIEMLFLQYVKDIN